jgi:hypothetical protein
LRYQRDDEQSTAWGSVIVADTAGTAVMRGDTVENDPRQHATVVQGNAEVWRAQTDDTAYIAADVLHAITGDAETYTARGSVRFVRNGMASRADSMHYDLSTGMIALVGHPVVWSDNTMLVADSMVIEAPNRVLRRVVGQGNAFMASKNDTVRLDRVDQLRGDEVTFLIEQDTLRTVQAVGNTQSLYFGSEAGEPQGLAQFVSDTTRILFADGSPEDIIWLGGIRGEHHPESIVSERVATYRLPGYVWRDDRPLRPMPPSTIVLLPKSM